MLCVSNNHDRYWVRFGNRSKRHAPWHCLGARAGPKIAAILSIVESCRRLKLPVRNYLAAVLPGLADLPIQRLPNLIPAAWAT